MHGGPVWVCARVGSWFRVARLNNKKQSSVLDDHARDYAASAPFFLYLSMHNVHEPYQVPDRSGVCGYRVSGTRCVRYRRV